MSSPLLGGDVNAQAPNGDSVLYDAAGSGNPDCIELLLQHGADPNIANLSSRLPIHCAAYEGHYLLVQGELQTHSISTIPFPFSHLSDALIQSNLQMR